MTWDIFLGFVALVSFIIAIVTPITRLTKTMTELTVSVKGLKDSLAEIVTKNQNSHNRLWEHNTKQDNTISDHEKRIGKLEVKLDVYEKEEN